MSGKFRIMKRMQSDWLTPIWDVEEFETHYAMDQPFWQAVSSCRQVARSSFRTEEEAIMLYESLVNPPPPPIKTFEIIRKNY